MFDFQKKNEIIYLKFVDNDKILSGVTTTVGGVSPEPFYSLNLGLNTNDTLNNVLENRNIFLNSFDQPYNLFSLQQTHSSTIIDLDIENDSKLIGDGFITTQKNMMISVTTADCGNVVITDKTNSIIGVFHAGWRGLENRIVPKGIILIKEKLEAMNIVPELSAYIGPMITGQNYEVGEEFLSIFDSKFIEKKENTFYLHTEKVLIDSLHQNGIDDIKCSGIDTFDNSNFFSYRRTNATGRTLTFAVLK